jgi:hypothetical protein
VGRRDRRRDRRGGDRRDHGCDAGTIRSTCNRAGDGPDTGDEVLDVGPSATYDFDNGGIGEVSALRSTFPNGSDYDAIVTVTLDYKTSPDDRFVTSTLVREGAEFGPIVGATPHARPIEASTVRTATTITYRLTGLTGGAEYWYRPTVNVSHRDNRASIESHHVLMVVDATPRP